MACVRGRYSWRWIAGGWLDDACSCVDRAAGDGCGWMLLLKMEVANDGREHNVCTGYHKSGGVAGNHSTATARYLTPLQQTKEEKNNEHTHLIYKTRVCIGKFSIPHFCFFLEFSEFTEL